MISSSVINRSYKTFISLTIFFTLLVLTVRGVTEVGSNYCNNEWAEDKPVISSKTFCGTGTRNLSDEGKKAIEDLFSRSFA